MEDKPLTRRGILSTVSSIYDPLGMAAPFLLVGKRILQDLCRDAMDWDEQISEEYRSRWEKWKCELLQLDKFETPRSLLPDNFGVVTSRQVHHFLTQALLDTDKSLTYDLKMNGMISIVRFSLERLG